MIGAMSLKEEHTFILLGDPEFQHIVSQIDLFIVLFFCNKFFYLFTKLTNLIIRFLKILYQQANTVDMISFQKILSENNLQRWQIFIFW